MIDLLRTVQEPSSIKNLKIEELETLAEQIRYFLIQSISQTGGHLASNLGVVELTIALHYVFNSPDDKFIWDVGHQAYVHKILTGRRTEFKNLRKMDGLSGFPKRNESEHDIFETGHSSTSISAALGIAQANKLKGNKDTAIAIIGDGALTGGLAYEALNNAGRSACKMIVILNDNNMSISRNVGGMNTYLSKLRSNKEYLRAKADVYNVLDRVPVVGSHMAKTLKKAKDGVKTMVIENTMFQEFGFTYLGPIDGHNLYDLIKILENAKDINTPVFIHVGTKKGKGYRQAEANPSKFHGIGPFNVLTGEGLNSNDNITFSSAVGSALVEIANEDENIVAITAAMPEGTGLSEFAKTYPKRFFDVGIAEEHATTFAAGLATNGFKPIFLVYSSFLQRAYDEVLHDVCLQNLPVVFGIDRAGVVGEDGETHQGIFDIAFLSTMPNMTILCPKHTSEIKDAFKLALSLNSPVAIRYPKGFTNINDKFLNKYSDLMFRTLKFGNNLAIISVGRMVETAFEVADSLNMHNIDAAVIEAPCVCPLADKEVMDIASKYDYIFTIEDGVLQGGFGERLFAHIITHGGTIRGRAFGFENKIITQGKINEVFKREGLDAESITGNILKMIQKESK